MLESKVLRKLRAGQPVLCTKGQFIAPTIVEMIGLMGFDCIWFCREHLALNDETIANMVRTARGTGMDALIRIERDCLSWSVKALEMAAKGLMFPYVITSEQAEDIVAANRFPPIGNRGIDGANADTGYLAMDTQEYLEFANRETFLALMIEDKEAIPNLESLAEVPGYDLLFVGSGDLSLSMGCFEETDSEEMWNIYEKVAGMAAKYGKFAGAPAEGPEHAKRLLDMGYLFLNDGADIVYLKNSFLALKKQYGKLGFTF